jgi:5-methylcytosine-specific restriction endonuclease McrA
MSLKRKQYFCPKCGTDKGFLITKKVRGISPEERICKKCRIATISEKQKGRIPWNKGVPLKEETKVKLRNCNLGKPSPTKGKTLSIETRKKLSCHNRGISINEFKDFTTPLNELERVKIKKSSLRQECFKKNNFTCQKCKIKGLKLNAHHINSFHRFIDLRFELSNLACLCADCHNMFHLIFGKKDNTEEQFIDFLEENYVKQMDEKIKR